jgi:hypothetical protein
MDIFDDGSIQVKSKQQTEVENEINDIKKGISFVKYRPNNLDEVILPSKLRNALKNSINNGYLDNHYAFYGTNGVGKTLTAEILFESLDIPYRKWNCSKTKNLGIADEISEYLKQTTLNGKPKGVIMDELGADHSDPFMAAMKGVIDQYNDVGRFIITSNHFNKIDPGIIDRCTCINFSSSPDIKDMKNQMYTRLVSIASDMLGDPKKLYDESGKILPGSQSTIISIINYHYPRVRSMIDSLSYNIKTNNGDKVDGNDFIVSDTHIKQVHDLLLAGDWMNARITFNQLFPNPFAFISPFIEHVVNNVKLTSHQAPLALICANWVKGIQSEVEPEVMITGGMFSQLIEFYYKMGYINNG